MFFHALKHAKYYMPRKIITSVIPFFLKCNQIALKYEKLSQKIQVIANANFSSPYRYVIGVAPSSKQH